MNELYERSSRECFRKLRMKSAVLRRIKVMRTDRGAPDRSDGWVTLQSRYDDVSIACGF